MVQRLAPCALLSLGAATPTWSQTGNVLKIACDAKAFAYRIRLHESGD